MPRYVMTFLLLALAALCTYAWLLPFISETVDTPVKVAWEGPYLDFTSLAHVNREFTAALGRQPGIEVARVGSKRLSRQGRRFPELNEALPTLHKNPPAGTEIAIRHSWPPKWEKPVEGKWVLIQPWEFGILPQSWIPQLEKVDEVWAYTHYVKQVYMDSGISPEKVHVVPDGFDPGVFHPGVEPRNLPTDKTFKFLFVGGAIHRKGVDILLETYMQTFRDSDNVCLVIKDFGAKGVYADQSMRDWILELQQEPGAPEILYFDEEMNIGEIAAIYKACDLLVYPYRGEGFALPVLEAMACGIPVMVSKGGATDDFVNDSCGWFIPCEKLFFGNDLAGLQLAGEGWMLEPDRESLSKMMRFASENRDLARQKGVAAAQYAKENWTWDHAAAIAAKRIAALRQQ